MSPDEIRRSWDDDDTPRSVFPEPLAERLTRENKELRAEVAAFRSALERTEANFRLAVQGKPVRDMAENLAENRAVLDKHTGDCRTEVRGRLDGIAPWCVTHKLWMTDRGCPKAGKHAGEQP